MARVEDNGVDLAEGVRRGRLHGTVSVCTSDNELEHRQAAAVRGHAAKAIR
ncbi:MAG: hypothetical protein HZB55_02400 [Deltaproteobacteria bacterium]|nr:hypothetical protein [Deltaproteobacteria bacterium]